MICIAEKKLFVLSLIIFGKKHKKYKILFRKRDENVKGNHSVKIKLL